MGHRQSRNCVGVRIDKLFEMINQEFKAQRTKYQELQKFGIFCREQRGLKVTRLHSLFFSNVDLWDQNESYETEIKPMT